MQSRMTVNSIFVTSCSAAYLTYVFRSKIFYSDQYHSITHRTFAINLLYMMHSDRHSLWCAWKIWQNEGNESVNYDLATLYWFDSRSEFAVIFLSLLLSFSSSLCFSASVRKCRQSFHQICFRCVTEDESRKQKSDQIHIDKSTCDWILIGLMIRMNYWIARPFRHCWTTNRTDSQKEAEKKKHTRI